MAKLDKVKALATEIKTHWNTPAEGKYVPYKEYKDVFLGVGFNYAGSKVLEYIGFADETTGVYPLTEDLKHIIINRGEYVGWFDASHSQYLFKDADGNPLAGINPDSAWLFMCSYAN